MSRADCEVCSGTGVAFGKVCSCAPIAPPASARPGCEACSGTGVSWGKRCPCFDTPPPKPGESIDTPLFRAVLKETFGGATGDWPRPLLASYINKWADQRAASERSAPTDADIEWAALLHIAPQFGMIGPKCDYKQTEQFSRLKAFVGALLLTRPTAVMAGGLSVLLSSMRESNGRETWGVRLLKSGDAFWDGHSVYTDAIKGRAQYEADSLKHFLGLGPAPDILSYDTDAPDRPPAMGAGDQDAAVAAIQFALDAEEGMAFLHRWNQGDFDVCRREWPEAPEAVYIGADPMHPQTVRPTANGAGGQS